MTVRTWLLAAAPVAMLSQPAWSAPQPPAQSGVLVFPPAFFAELGPNTAYDMINRLPGFGLDNGQTAQRGLAGSAGNVLIDGQRPSSKSDTLDQILRRIPAASVERVELIRGGAPGIDMQGRNVVANIVLKRNVQVERVIEANAYLYEDGYIGPLLKGQYSRRNGDSLIEGAVSATADRTGGTAQGSRLRFSPSGGLIQAADLDQWDRLVNVTGTGGLEHPLAGGKLRLHGLGSWERHDNTQDVLIRLGPGAGEATREHAVNINGELGGDWARGLGPRTGLTLTGLQHVTRETYDGRTDTGGATSDFGIRSTAGESIARAVVHFEPRTGLAWESGGEIAYNFLDSATTYAEDGVIVPLPNANVRVAELRGEGFSQFTWQASAKVTLEGGLRLEASKISQTGDTEQSKSFLYPKPRVQLTFTPLPGRQLRFRVQRDVSQLDFGQFTASTEINLGSVQGGNADLEPQKSTIYEVTYEHRFWERGVLELIGSHTDLEDVIDVIPLAGGVDGIGNIGKGRQRQFIARLTLPLDRLGLPNARFLARGTWTHTRVQDPLTGELRRISNIGEFGCTLQFNQELAGGRFSYGAEHGCNTDRSNRYRVAELRETVVAPFIMAYVQWKPTPRSTLRVDMGAPGGQEVLNRRLLFAGPRNLVPLNYLEERRVDGGPWMFVQFRREL